MNTLNVDQNVTSSTCRRKEERLKEILTAALEEFSINGFAGTRLEDVAKRAGICKATIYLYFKSKEELFVEVVRDRVLPHIEKLENMSERPEGNAKDLLRQQLTIIYQELLSTDARFIPKLIISEASRFPELAQFYFEEIITGIHKVSQNIIARGVAAGEFRSSALNWEQQAILGPALSAVIWITVFNEFEPLDLETYLETHIDLLLHGLEK